MTTVARRCQEFVDEEDDGDCVFLVLIASLDF